MKEYLTKQGNWGLKEGNDWSQENDKGADVIPYEKLEKMAKDLGIEPFPMKAPFDQQAGWNFVAEGDWSADAPLVNASALLHPKDDIKGWDLEYWFCSIGEYNIYRDKMTEKNWADAKAKEIYE